ncbi:MAG: DUF393 domain-containing protein [Chthoniobacterales bacterium]|nr:DUF393 domain-containing protein [Chthoniobacterales bacterium]
MNPTWKLKILFDGDCPFCKREVAFMKRRNHQGGLSFEDITSPDFDPSAYGLTQDQVMGVIHGILADGKVIKKVAVFVQAYQLIGLGWLVAPFSWPIVGSLANIAYSIFARYRIRLGRLFGRLTCVEEQCARCKKE